MQKQREEHSRFVQPTPETSLQANPINDWHDAYDSDETKETLLNTTTSVFHEPHISTIHIY